MSLVDERGHSSPTQLSIQVTQDLTSAVTGDVVEQAQITAQKLLHSLVDVRHFYQCFQHYFKSTKLSNLIHCSHYEI
jgi:hypothetical protein